MSAVLKKAVKLNHSLTLIKYAHINPISDFCIFVIPDAIFQAGAFKFSSVGALNTLININPGFCDDCKILILQII